MTRAGAPAALAWLWLGLVIGVSFLATPVKFSVADLDLPTALQVGRVTFALFGKLEWGLAPALVAACALAPRRSVMALSLAALIAAGVLIQALWLLPTLDARVSAIIAGQMPPPSLHHHAYTGIELMKACFLAAIGVGSASANAALKARLPLHDRL